MRTRYIMLTLLISLGTIITAQENLNQNIEPYAKAAFRYFAKAEQSQSQLKVKDSFTQTKDGQSYYHIVNFENGGFVILSGSSDYDAVLGFSDTGRISFKESERNPGIWEQLSKHENIIAQVINEEIKAPARISKQWNRLKQIADNDKNLKSISFTPVVGPLTTTTWGQSGWYNYHTPMDEDGPGGNTYAGCVPIAVSQTLRYWANPLPGSGSISYEDPIYGTQNVDYCGQRFDYENMPDAINEFNPTLSKFIYEVGASMKTHYSIDYTGTYRTNIPDALVYNFGFDQDIRWFTTANQQRYSETLRTEFDAGRIVILAAKAEEEDGSIGAGHVWVADGYGYTSDNVEYMHMNWGWNGNDNGWFLDNPGAWLPHVDNVDQDEIPYYWWRTTFYNIKPANEYCVSPDSRDIEMDPYNNHAWVSNYRSEQELVKFRYRESGTNQWTETDPTFDYDTHIVNLKQGTTYEYQSARNCCGEWSRFSDVAQFVTSGTDPGDDDNVDDRNCPKENTSEMRTSAVSENFAYIYTSQPNGRVNNQFRYKISQSDEEWTETGISDSHYRALRDLRAGTTYQFQVNHECSAGKWSGYSESFEFTTSGTAPVDDTEEPTDDENNDNTDPNCQKEDPAQMKVSAVQDHFAYAYTSQPNGRINNIFRYRVVGTTDWTLTDTDDLHYRALRDLKSGTNYEYQVNHQCGPESYSGYSDSFVFTTTGTTENTNEETGGDENSGGEEDNEMPVDSNCQNENPADMKVSSVSHDFAYVYSSLPNGTVNNLFRYRVVGNSTWTTTDKTNKHYRALTNLSSNTTYEYQVNHECSTDAWSGWSTSFQFGTSSFTAGASASLRSREEPLPLLSKDLELQLDLYPNPTSELLNISVSAEIRNDLRSNSLIEVLDQTGRIVKATTIADKRDFQLNISDLSNGMYILRFIDSRGNSAVNRFIKI